MIGWHASDIAASFATRQPNTRSRFGIALEQNWNASLTQACFSSKVSALALPVVLNIQAARSTTASVRNLRSGSHNLIS